ncbi:MAG: hypothetical protein M4579_005502 [Chaenotheca gracillima]|nr:MAG: hypothetical protein M4579_005502 [Chaenotheca gracillima]
MTKSKKKREKQQAADNVRALQKELAKQTAKKFVGRKRTPRPPTSLLRYKTEQLTTRVSSSPEGYSFLEKGDPYLTLNCRKVAFEAEKVVYVVHQPGKSVRKGLHVPNDILEQVKAKAANTAEERQHSGVLRDQRTIAVARVAIYEALPAIPTENAEQVLSHGFLKGSGRVGRSTTMSQEKKIMLATIAHIRHTETSYEELLRQHRRQARLNGAPINGMLPQSDKVHIRRQVQRRVNEVLKKWRGPRDIPNPPAKKKKKSKAQKRAEKAEKARLVDEEKERAVTASLASQKLSRSEAQARVLEDLARFAREASLADRASTKGRTMPEPEIIDLLSDSDVEEAVEPKPTRKTSCKLQYEEDDGPWEPEDDLLLTSEDREALGFNVIQDQQVQGSGGDLSHEFEIALNGLEEFEELEDLNDDSDDYSLSESGENSDIDNSD